jgi:hypothetical protein
VAAVRQQLEKQAKRLLKSLVPAEFKLGGFDFGSEGKVVELLCAMALERETVDDDLSKPDGWLKATAAETASAFAPECATTGTLWLSIVAEFAHVAAGKPFHVVVAAPQATAAAATAAPAPVAAAREAGSSSATRTTGGTVAKPMAQAGAPPLTVTGGATVAKADKAPAALVIPASVTPAPSVSDSLTKVINALPSPSPVNVSERTTGLSYSSFRKVQGAFSLDASAAKRMMVYLISLKCSLPVHMVVGELTRGALGNHLPDLSSFHRPPVNVMRYLTKATARTPTKVSELYPDIPSAWNVTTRLVVAFPVTNPQGSAVLVTDLQGRPLHVCNTVRNNAGASFEEMMREIGKSEWLSPKVSNFITATPEFATGTQHRRLMLEVPETSDESRAQNVAIRRLLQPSMKVRAFIATYDWNVVENRVDQLDALRFLAIVHTTAGL